MSRLAYCVAALTIGLTATSARGAIRITEWMYNSAGASSLGEFVEFTNLAATSIDMTGWSFDDDSRTPGTFSLSGFGVVAPLESVILTDNSPVDFRTAWGLAPTIKIVGGNSANLGRSDEINIYDAAGMLVDRLAYGDQTFAGTIRTNEISGNPSSPLALGANDVALWQLSSIGDDFGSVTSTAGEVGNPGSYPIPEPATAAMLLTIVWCLAPRVRR